MPGLFSRSLPRYVGLLLAALVTLCLMTWLATSQSQAVGLGQENSPISPGELPTATPFDTATDTPVPPVQDQPDATPTDTPVPDTPTPEPPTATPSDTPTATPTDTPTDTPTPEPTATSTATPTATPTPTPTVRPIVIPTATPEPTLFSVAGQVIDVALTSAAWIWLTCGSLVFFAVAGAFAGFSFYRQSRQRYNLFEIVPEEEAPSMPKGRDPSPPPDEDSWPSSLP
ncbi:MAG: hypothetical protein WBO46_07025 [Caldilineaceae bacterium]